MKGRWWSPSETVTRELPGGVSVVVFDVAIESDYRLKALRARFPRSPATREPHGPFPRETQNCSQNPTSPGLPDGTLVRNRFQLDFRGFEAFACYRPDTASDEREALHEVDREPEQDG